MEQHLQKSLIATTRQEARASLQEPSRPFTPADQSRHLFSGDDYSNRPVSSYKLRNVVGQAVEEFNSAANATATSSSSTLASSAQGKRRSGSKVEPKKSIISVLNATDLGARKKQLPALAPLPAKEVKAKKSFEAGKPVKPVAPQKQTSSGKPDQEYQELLDENKKAEESLKFSETVKQTQEKHEEIVKQIKQANRKRDEDDYEVEDEYDDYFAIQIQKDIAGVEHYEQQAILDKKATPTK